MSPGLTVEPLLGRLARDELPWHRAWVADFPTFDERFTLHDSTWIGAFLALREQNEVILIVEWDAHWLPEPLRTECMGDAAGAPAFGCPFLLIRVPAVRGMELSGYEQSCGGRAISYAALSVSGKVMILEIVDFAGGTVRLDFSGRLEFLALCSQDGRVLDLSQVKPRAAPPALAKPWWHIW
jgi:hypothetical protein